jgi:hypothetical protein
MIKNKKSFILNSLSKVFDSEIYFITSAIKTRKSDDLKQKDFDRKKNNTSSNYTILITYDSIIILRCGLDRVKIRLYFSSLQQVDVHDNNECVFNLSDLNFIKKNDFHVFNLNEFLKVLQRRYTLYWIQQTGKVQNLEINMGSNIVQKLDIDVVGQMSKVTKKDIIVEVKDSYIFLLRYGYSRNGNIFNYDKISDKDIQLVIDVESDIPIERQTLDDKHFYFYAFNKFRYFMDSYYKIKDYAILKNTAFIKKHNYFNDPAVWEGWKIEARTKATKDKGLNFIFIFLRRNYIPPTFGLCDYITLIITETYSPDHHSASVEKNEKPEAEGDMKKSLFGLLARASKTEPEAVTKSPGGTMRSIFDVVNKAKSISLVKGKFMNLVQKHGGTQEPQTPVEGPSKNISQLEIVNEPPVRDSKILRKEIKIVRKDYPISKLAKSIIEHAAQHITPENHIPVTQEIRKLVQMQMESLMFDKFSFNYLKNTLGLIPKGALKLAISFVYKLILLMEDNIKEDLSKIKKSMKDRTLAFYSQFDERDFNITNFEKILKAKDIQNILTDNEILFKEYFEGEVNNDILNIWIVKRNDFLMYCLDGFLIPDLNIQLILNFCKKNTIFATKLGPSLKQLLNIKVKFFNFDNLDQSNLETIVNYSYDIQDFHINNKMLSLMIKNNYLVTLYEISNEEIIVQFLEYLLKNHLTNNLLYSIFVYLKSTVKFDNNEDIPLFHLGYNDLFSVLLNIYSNEHMSPITTKLACESLIILGKNKHNLKLIVDCDTLLIIEKYLKSPYEDLVLISAKLLLLFLQDTQENVNKLLSTQYRNIIPNILKILKRHPIPGCEYNMKITSIVMSIVLFLLRMGKSLLKSILHNEKKIKYLKYLAKYIDSLELVNKADTELELAVKEKTFQIITEVVSKVPEKRDALDNQCNLFDFIDARVEEYMLILKAFLNRDESLGHAIDNFELYMQLVKSLMIFIREFVAGDREVISKCPNIDELIQYILNNSDRDQLKEVHRIAHKIYNQLQK